MMSLADGSCWAFLRRLWALALKGEVLIAAEHAREPRPAPERDSDGRFVSPHRLAVRAKCRKMLTDMGKEIPEVLR